MTQTFVHSVGSPDGYIYDFWKERYPDDDYGKQPNRKANPRPVTPPDAGNSPAQNVSEAAPKKKSKLCTIL